MKTLQIPLYELAEYDEMKNFLAKQKETILVSGCVDSGKPHIIDGLSETYRYKLVITHNAIRAKELYEGYKFYDRNVMLFPAKDLIFFQADVHGNELVLQRIRCIKRLMQKRPVTIVTTFDSLMAPQIPLKKLEETMIHIGKNSSIDEGKLSECLIAMGYEKNYQVEEPGQFSIRGDIVDIFDLTEENPYRIELWGDEIESIRSFDILSQRSIEQLQQIDIFPATELILTREELLKGIDRIEKEAKEQYETLRKEFHTEEAHRIKSQVQVLREELIELGLSRNCRNLEGYVRYFYKDLVSLMDYFDQDKTLVIVDEATHVMEHADAVLYEFRESMSHRLEKGYILPGQAKLLYDVEETLHFIQKYPVLLLSALDQKTVGFKPAKKYDVHARSVSAYNNSFSSLVKDLQQYKKNQYRVVVVSGSRTRAKRLAQDLQEEGFTAYYTEDPEHTIQPGEIITCYGAIQRGFEYPLLKFAVISETDIFGVEKKKKKKQKRYDGQKINDFADLQIGDYVVHESHGLGVYRGIEKVEVEKVIKDYIKIEYRDGGNLYIPATGLDLIQKYASADTAKVPKINKLGTQEWIKTKTKVKSAVNEVAKELVELYAIRQQKEGYQYDQDTIWQKEFEELFPYEETEDQLLAIEATKADMESKRIMDRLICGDVGYGKTEIAIRAAFKAVQEGKQVVYLVPTTILAQQHYNTFIQRMKDFPVRVDLMSRFRTASEQKKTIEGLKKGFVDIVIGTHRVLSKDIQFHDLGLLIIDEEQRFGVAHKEKIKQLKNDVDVLALSATPIPRTLHMSLIGIRDMSVLEEAPNERLPIQTFVCEYNEEIVREAIVRELARDGQVYYVYNRVNNIADVSAQIQALVPEANVAYAHGQMKEQELERIMYDFINGDIDVLVSTTIIETGLDIPNVNTMIIHDSDNMGLSQLYQLRGRVGRSNRTAYAFMMYKRDKMLKEVAEKRLAAIKEFTDLGSGFKIAMRDLEIRGAGNLLGKVQHGHMAAVGYDLYCKMLNEAVKTLKGIEVTEGFDTTIDLDVDAYIPPTYIVNEVQKLEIYKRIASIENQNECEDMREELLDRFGEVPVSVENLLRISLLRGVAHQLFITEVRGKNERIIFQMKQDAAIHVENIPELLKRENGKLTFDPKGIPTFIYKYKKCGIVEKDERILLEETERLIRDAFPLLVEVDS